MDVKHPQSRVYCSKIAPSHDAESPLPPANQALLPRALLELPAATAAPLQGVTTGRRRGSPVARAAAAMSSRGRPTTT
jgi:hypothetical protein